MSDTVAGCGPTGRTVSWIGTDILDECGALWAQILVQLYHQSIREMNLLMGAQTIRGEEKIIRRTVYGEGAPSAVEADAVLLINVVNPRRLLSTHPLSSPSYFEVPPGS